MMHPVVTQCGSTSPSPSKPAGDHRARRTMAWPTSPSPPRTVLCLSGRRVRGEQPDRPGLRDVPGLLRHARLICPRRQGCKTAVPDKLTGPTNRPLDRLRTDKFPVRPQTVLAGFRIEAGVDGLRSNTHSSWRHWATLPWPVTSVALHTGASGRRLAHRSECASAQLDHDMSRG
jgi:hypothetical protein